MNPGLGLALGRAWAQNGQPAAAREEFNTALALARANSVFYPLETANVIRALRKLDATAR